MRPMRPIDGSQGSSPGWMVLVVAAGLAYLAHQLVLPALYLPTTVGDFANYHRAGAALWAGESPYSVAKFDYPPLLAFLAAPLARLPLETARWLGFVIAELCLLGAAWLTWRWLGRDRVAGGAVLAVWCLAGTVPENLVLGQINPVLLLLAAAALHAWDRRPGTAGAALGIATALKLWPGVLAVGFLAQRRGRALAAMTITAAVLLLGPWLWIRTQLPGPASPTTAGYWRGTPAPLNFSLPAVALRVAEPPRDPETLPESWVTGHDPEALHLSPADGALSVAVSLTTLLAGLGALAAVVRRRRREGRPPLPEGLLPSALLSLCLVAATLSWYHYQLLHLPVLAWLGARWWRRDAARGVRRRLPWAGLVLLGTGLTRGQNLFGLYVEGFGWTARAPVLLWAVTSLVPLLNLLLFGLLLRETQR